MKTSIIEHPKFEIKSEFYEWQVEASRGNKLTAQLLSIYEDRLNKVFELPYVVRLNGWQFFSYSELSKLTINPNTSKIHQQILDSNTFLESIGFVQIEAPEEIRQSNESTEKGCWVRLNAKVINDWLEIYKQKKFNKPPMKVEITGDKILFPFLVLLTGQVGKNLVKQISLEKYPEDIKKDAETLVEFWRAVLKHPKAKIEPKYLKMIMDKMQSGYSFAQCLQAVIGITYSEHNVGGTTKYDHIEHIFSTSERFMRNLRLAQSNGYDEHKTLNLMKSLLNPKEVEEEIEEAKGPYDETAHKLLAADVVDEIISLQKLDKIVLTAKNLMSGQEGFVLFPEQLKDFMVNGIKKHQFVDENMKNKIDEVVKKIQEITYE